MPARQSACQVVMASITACLLGISSDPRMSEENNLTSGADDLPPAIQKTKEQWLDEGNFLSFYAPIRSEEGLAAYEQAIRLDPTYALAWRMKATPLRSLKRYEEALAAYEQAISLDATDAQAY